jgi:hypothetical protein
MLARICVSHFLGEGYDTLFYLLNHFQTCASDNQTSNATVLNWGSSRSRLGCGSDMFGGDWGGRWVRALHKNVAEPSLPPLETKVVESGDSPSANKA